MHSDLCSCYINYGHVEDYIILKASYMYRKLFLLDTVSEVTVAVTYWVAIVLIHLPLMYISYSNVLSSLKQTLFSTSVLLHHDSSDAEDGAQFNTVATQLQPQKTLMNRGEVITCDMSACTQVGIPLVLLRRFTPDVTHQDLNCFCLKWHVCVPFVAHFVQRTLKIKEAVSCQVAFCCIFGAYSQQSNSKTAVHMAKYSRSIHTYNLCKEAAVVANWLSLPHRAPVPPFKHTRLTSGQPASPPPVCT